MDWGGGGGNTFHGGSQGGGRGDLALPALSSASSLGVYSLLNEFLRQVSSIAASQQMYSSSLFTIGTKDFTKAKVATTAQCSYHAERISKLYTQEFKDQVILVVWPKAKLT